MANGESCVAGRLRNNASSRCEGTRKEKPFQLSGLMPKVDRRLAKERGESGSDEHDWCTSTWVLVFDKLAHHKFSQGTIGVSTNSSEAIKLICSFFQNECGVN